jgi:tetratricopeptide (TPR) repeat protein
MNSQESLGQRLRDLRLRRGISQAQLAFPELSDSYVSLIESGKRLPAQDVIELLARKLGCSASYLASGVSGETVTELRMILKYGEISLENGEVEEARVSFAKILNHPSMSAMPDMMNDVRWGLARALEASGDLENAVAELENLAQLISPEDDPDRWAWLHIALCRCYRERGDFSAGVSTGEEGLRRLSEVQTRWTEATVMLGVTLLGVFLERGDLVYAHQLANRLIARAEDVGSARARAAAYWNAGIAAEYRGDPDEGLRLGERALALLGETDDTRNLARLRTECGRLMLRVRPDQAERARDLIQQARQELADCAASEIDHVRCVTALAKAEIALARPAEAVRLAEEAIDLLGQGPRFLTADVLIVLANGYVGLDRIDAAVGVLQQAAETLEGMQSQRQAAQTWFDLAELLGRTGDEKQRAQAYRHACACAGLG